MSRTGTNFRKGLVGANKQNRDDAVSALIANGPAIPGKLANGEVVIVTTIKEAEAKGLNAAYDTDNKVCVFRHISEFFRIAGEGVELAIILAVQTVLPADLLGAAYAEKLITETAGRVRQVAVAYNPPANYVPVLVDGMEEAIRLAIPAAQNFANWTFDTFRPVHVCIEGRGISATAATAINLRNIQVNGSTAEYNQVSLMIGQDWNYAETLDAIGKKFADVGTLLGTIAACKVCENIGEVGTRNITDTVRKKWLTSGISSHIKITAIEAALSDWDTKGYILAWDYQDSAVPGYRFNNDHVCAPIAEDAEGNLNEHSIALSRTNAKVFRGLRSAYLPKVKSVQPVDAATGKLPIGIVKSLEKIGDNVFADMTAAGEISGGETTVNPDSNLQSGEKILETGYEWVPMGTIGKISGTVNVKSSLQ